MNLLSKKALQRFCGWGQSDIGPEQTYALASESISGATELL